MQRSCRLRCRCFVTPQCPLAAQIVDRRLHRMDQAWFVTQTNGFPDDRSQCSISGRYTFPFSLFYFCLSVAAKLLLGPVIFINRAAAGGRGSRIAFGFLNRAAVGWAVSCSAFGILGIFFSFVGEQTQTPTRPLLSPDDVSALFVISPRQEHFVKLAN